jgi:hypothetical protein
MYFVWYDDNPKKTVTAKIDEAVLRYKQKFGKQPNVCKVNEKLLGEETNTGVAGVKVESAKNVPQNYFWIGNEV